MTRGDMGFHADRDGVWRALRIAAPARRALVNVELYELAALTQVTRAFAAEQHGMGPKALVLLDTALERNGLAFKRA